MGWPTCNQLVKLEFCLILRCSYIFSFTNTIIQENRDIGIYLTGILVLLSVANFNGNENWNLIFHLLQLTHLQINLTCNKRGNSPIHSHTALEISSRYDFFYRPI